MKIKEIAEKLYKLENPEGDYSKLIIEEKLEMQLIADQALKCKLIKVNGTEIIISQEEDI